MKNLIYIIVFLPILISCFGKEVRERKVVKLDLINKNSNKILNLNAIFIEEDYKKKGVFYKMTDTLSFNQTIEINSKFIFQYNLYYESSDFLNENENFIEFNYLCNNIKYKKLVKLNSIFSKKILALELDDKN